MVRVSVKKWFKNGDPWVWFNAGAVAISMVMVFGLLYLIASRGLVHFWAHDVMQAQVEAKDGSSYTIIGEMVETVEVSAIQLRDAGYSIPEGLEHLDRNLIKLGNRDITGADFRWILDRNISDKTYPEDIIVMERREWGNFYGYLKQVIEADNVVAENDAAWPEFETRLERALEIYSQIHEIEKGEIGSINAGMERLRLKQRKLELENRLTAQAQAEIAEERAVLDAQYAGLQDQLIDLYTQINRDKVRVQSMDGTQITVDLAKVVNAYQPNAMSLGDKLGFYVAKLYEFVSDEPREANTEGGIFPAIFGTVLMVIIMSIIVTPFGVIAAVYLREYAHQGTLTRIIRIAVNNLAGVPSIVYGVFGLGFFIYFVGSGIDQAFFPEALPSPTYGTGGLLWASITLAILTLPVVIVATEEGLSRIPRSIREGSLALGATKAETLWRVILPMASPAMMTGVILAIARAAGEVAPLMLVGVVKLAPSLPLDGNYPYLHLDQKFMHLGFHIYDVGFQSPNVEAARPLVYATSLLLVAVIALLNLSAVAIRNRLREKYKALEM
ncbi:phosphate ABC transporter, permease protein PstA [Oleiphilus sp. HI0071]|nr:phosphate ABC transporter, permease protein PstA [Oleiphilus sp. HI0065]KZY80448.1 phosphate ABC transporter, permease protein PstA [Oleiphilus sp. HI0071]KZY93077.1 phosphate ABC transporter, permease protein PstA [Oleiphilus sp. HI0073]KZZ16985.1 phosphate ABC transporter, permease protein PstA [Oleiphilus sp. HI0079]KZZ17305.1 phosphate ABC transporter, permease protein PstA [Oleiphilus sp. HI0080]KZZ51607.1 phosphate ABC transporter, permease protein PstA [Oleiphilus sp. HI0122]KZZ5477